MEQVDVKRITAEVAARHGVLLRQDDPALVLVTIAEVVLEGCFEKLENRSRGLMAELVVNGSLTAYRWYALDALFDLSAKTIYTTTANTPSLLAMLRDARRIFTTPHIAAREPRAAASARRRLRALGMTV